MGLLAYTVYDFCTCSQQTCRSRIDEAFGLNDYQEASPPLPLGASYVVFANDSEWTHIADDFGYTLWHRSVEAIAELSASYDVFRNSIGDIDNSFEFEYYRDGKLVRKFVFEDNVFERTQIVTADSGAKLIGEPKTFDSLKSSAQKMLPEITEALGIVRVTDPLKNRFYAKNQEK